MNTAVDSGRLYRMVRILLAFFMFCLVAAGLTAFPLIAEVNALNQIAGTGSPVGTLWPDMGRWISFVQRGLNETNNQYPFIFYGTDWLAFAHLMIAVAFIGPYRDPTRNIWVVEFGMIACVLLIPLALICRPMRGIPPFWTVIDMSFGVFGIIPLIMAHRAIRQIMRIEEQAAGGGSQGVVRPNPGPGIEMPG